MSTQSEVDISALGSVLQDKRCRFREFSLQGVTLGRSQLTALCAAIRGNGLLQILSLSNTHLQTTEATSSLWHCLESLPSLRVLDLSHNSYFPPRLTNEGISGLCEFIEETETLTTLILDGNAVSGLGLAVAVANNDSLQSVSLDNNPLSFEAVMGLLDALVSNKTLQYLGISGCRFEGAAPIKENSNGLLSKIEVITLKLAQVLRHSGLVALGFDLDPDADVQLEELESTLVKHNRSLTTIHSKGIDWTKVRGALAGINRALKANQWIAQNEKLPKSQRLEPSKEIEELIAVKARKRTDMTSSPSSVDAYPRSLRNPRSPSPTLLRSQDSAPVTASPEALVHLRLQEPTSEDIHSVGQSTGTPQFTPNTSAFLKRSFRKKGDNFLRSPGGNSKELLTEPSQPTPFSAERTQSPPLYRAKEQPYLDSMRADSDNLRKIVTELAARLAILEEKSEKHIEKVIETQDNLEETQKMLKKIEFKVEEKHVKSSEKSEFLLRLEKVEKQEQGKFRLFESLASEIETLKASQIDSFHQFNSFTDQFKSEMSRYELLLKLNTEKTENTGKILTNLQSKQEKLETKMEKLRKETIDGIRAKCKKEVWEGMQKVENRIQSIETALKKYREKQEDFSGELSSQWDAGKLEERLCDLEREVTNFGGFKKKLLETGKKIRGIEQILSASKEILTPKNSEKSVLLASKQSTAPSNLKENTSDNLREFLPGEAESVVLGALMERTRRGKRSLADFKLSYRSISPTKPGNVRVREPSVDLQEYLRLKGFSFVEG